MHCEAAAGRHHQSALTVRDSCLQAAHAAKKGVIDQALWNSEYAQELYKRRGCVHSRLQNIETDCWVYKGGVPEKLPPKVKLEDVYFWRTAFDPDGCMPRPCEAGVDEEC